MDLAQNTLDDAALVGAAAPAVGGSVAVVKGVRLLVIAVLPAAFWVAALFAGGELVGSPIGVAWLAFAGVAIASFLAIVCCNLTTHALSEEGRRGEAHLARRPASIGPTSA